MTNTANFTWEDPPLASRVGGRWKGLAQDLREEPGRWAVVARGNQSLVTTAVQSLKRHGCEAMQRLVDGELRAYARWPEGDSNA